MSNGEPSGIRDLAKRSVATLRRDGFDRLLLYGTRYLSWTVGFHRFVRSLPNPIATAVFLLVRGTVRRTVRLLHGVYPRKYTDADPYKLIVVDPSSITHTSNPSRRRGWVVDGTWDQEGEVFMQRPRPQAIAQRFAEGREWEQTVLADEYDERELEERAEAIEQLYRQISDEGYRSQRRLLEENPAIAWTGLNDAMHPLANDIAVDIGRDGEILWNRGGQHRLAIAKVLEIDRIPVQVFRRHSTWQTIRHRARQGEDIPPKLRDHPDLADVLENNT